MEVSAIIVESRRVSVEQDAAPVGRLHDPL
jgi:hypothetical protein